MKPPGDDAATDPAADLSPSLLGGDGGTPVAAFEQKFVVDAAIAARILAWARVHLRVDPHGEIAGSGEYGVTTLYLDTPDFAVFHRAPELQGAKFRIRRYGSEPLAWLEKKVRTADRVHKRRTPIALAEVARFAAPAATPARAQRPDDWFDDELRALDLVPVCCIDYRRTAFFGSGDHGGFRLTLDRTIGGEARRAWHVDAIAPAPAPAPATATRIEVVADRVVCELKFQDALPQLVKQLVVEVGLEPASFSKYRRIALAAGLVEAKCPDAA